MKIKIGSFNIKNSKINKNGGINDNQDNVLILSDIIKDNKFDLIGFQELSPKFTNRLISILNKYKLCGKYRFSKFLTKFKIFREWNEASSILTRFDIISSKTYHLPWFPRNIKDIVSGIKKTSIIPRVVTVALIKYDDYYFYHVNTHIEKQDIKVKKRQLHKIIKIISSLDKDFIITGDFNMSIEDKEMIDFLENVSKFDMKRVSIDDGTYRKNPKAIDHIFVPNKYKIIDFGLLNDSLVSTITDHNIIYVEVSIN